MDAAVERAGAPCFGACPQPLDRISDCYLNCYVNTLTGDPACASPRHRRAPSDRRVPAVSASILRTDNLTKMEASEIVAPWLRGFEEDEVANGGCARVEPLPCQGEQCPLKLA